MTSSSMFHVHSLPHFLFMDPEMTSFINSILWGRELIVFRLYVLLDNQTTLLNCLETEKIHKSETDDSYWCCADTKDWHRAPFTKVTGTLPLVYSLRQIWILSDEWLAPSVSATPRLRSERLGLSDWRSRSRWERLLTIWTYTACGNITQQSFVKQFFNIYYEHTSDYVRTTPLI